ncbi:fimbrial protein [Photobacterium damselae]|uniref:PefA n=1 Tax=Photobacterium damselae subsp. damselae CIP 102761 TaxID=675817 RepID=D0Z5B3_PHODD|nr:hypothetical protein [Photobacterium damselae]EEZ39035.1 PefA [Photobacterium damselae subsp. damselae CIP 102761]PSW79348.1 hypothetical protein CTN07_20710 [Photobacterium damselae]
MKKTILALTALASLGMVSSAMAAPGNVGTIRFIGSITDTTCDFTGEQGGAQSNVVNLGTHTTAVVNGATGSPVVDFSLVGTKPDGSACEISSSVDVSWVPASGSWTASGLLNTGTATNTVVKLMDKNNKVFNALYETVNYVASDAPKGQLPFKANIMNTGTNATAGTVVSAAKFAVAYK